MVVNRPVLTRRGRYATYSRSATTVATAVATAVATSVVKSGKPSRTRRRAGRVAAGPSSVPPAGFEPALPPPEGGALSPELRGPIHVR